MEYLQEHLELVEVIEDYTKVHAPCVKDTGVCKEGKMIKGLSIY